MVYSDQATTGQRRRRGEARVYDFRRPVRLAREHSHVLRVAMQTFARQSTTVLTTSLRVVCQVASAQLEELSYDEYLSGLPDQSVCAVITLDPLMGKALWTFDLSTLLTLIDHQLGGPGGDDQPERPLTDIEQALTRQLLQRMLRELAYAFEPLAKVHPLLKELEVNAGFVQAAAPTDPVVVARMDLTIGNSVSESSLCLPFMMLSPVLEELTNSDDAEEKAKVRRIATERTQRRLSDVEVAVGVRFDPIRLSSQSIGRLAVGDVVALGHRTTRPLTVTSASTTFAHAVPGSSGKTLAVLIIDPT